MSGVVFYFQTFDKDVFSSRPIDLDAWRYALQAGGITKARCLNEADANISLGIDDFEIIGTHVDDLLAWQQAHSEDYFAVFDTQWTCPPDAIPLQNLDHSQVDWYVFGGGNGIPVNLPGQRVYLPQSGTGSLHSVHVASAVMFRRWEELNK